LATPSPDATTTPSLVGSGGTTSWKPDKNTMGFLLIAGMVVVIALFFRPKKKKEHN
jgi:hypothetical protein